MDKNVVRFGLIGIILLVIFAAAQLYPPTEKLKPGIDLAGGTSLIYDIDTTGLVGGETDNLATKLRPILLKRIDPGNIQNIVMRPQGDTRIEIQVPLASADTHRRRQAYDDAMNTLTKDNINLAIIKRALTQDPNERAKIFEKFAADSNDRKEILSQLASTYDARKAAQEKRDDLRAKLDTIAQTLEKDGINKQALFMLGSSWGTMDPNEKKATIDRILADVNDKSAVKTASKQALRGQQIEQYFAIFTPWADVVNELTKPETGLNAAYRDAETRLKDFNLSIEALTTVLEMPETSSKRAELLGDFKNRFSSRADKIDALVKAFKDYRTVRGRIDGPEDVKRMLKGTGVLEFRILPALNDGRTNRDELVAYAEALKIKGPKLASDNKYVWVQIENPKDSTWQASETHPILVGTFAEKSYVLASNQDNECMLKKTGKRPWKLQKAGTTIDEMGKRAISFTFDEIAASLFYNVTRNNLQRPLVITLDGLAISAPNIRSAIRSNGIIEGNYSQTEQTDMVDKLNAGSLPARLIEPPISEKTIGPSIGADNRDKGIKSGLVGLAAVIGFMAFYYTIGGMIADAALFLNILFLLAIMVISNATFTLGGIAGIVLTIGMSVDANVLIFERIREEQEKGASLRVAIDNGYHRAFWVIFDSNLTTILSALILYMVASEEIKGFAITLMLGLSASLFTSLFVTRVIFQILLNKGIIRNHLVMLHVIRNVKIDWMKLRPIMITFSAILALGGLYAFFTRDDVKNNKYDIEFTGGTNVQVDFKPENPLDRSEVEKIISTEGEKLGNPAIAAAKVYSVGDRTTKLQYEITTTETNKAAINVTFKAGSQETAKTVTQTIETTQKKLRGIITNMLVTQSPDNPAKFTITTSQTNKSVINNILSTAFGGKAEISEPVVKETVTEAVLNAFKGKLQIMESLNPHITSTAHIDDAMLDKTPELTNFLGGVRIEFTVEKPATIAEIDKRLKALRFKPDMQNVAWYGYQLTGADLNTSITDKPLTNFTYVSVPEDAGYRQLSEDEWTNFVTNETGKITSAAELQTSLSRVTQFAPSIGDEAKTRAVIAIVLSLIAMAIYLWVRFGDLRYGFGAIFSLIHDVCIGLGAVMISVYLANTAIGQKLLITDFKIDLTVIAALLTLVGYSVNDTIVVFDRIRENMGKLAVITPQLINDSINQTLSRTILTSFTTFLVVIIMYIFGGTGFRAFNYVMTIGIVVGTYSSIAIAAPVLILGKKVKTKTTASK